MPLELVLSAALIIIVDQLSKLLVTGRLAERWCCSLAFRGWVHPFRNRVAPATLIRDRRALLGLWGIAVLGTFLVTRAVPAFQTPTQQVLLGTAIGGATSNLLDQLRARTVVDFIDLRVWPVFNVADAAIVVGVLGAFTLTMTESR
jgi:signal peptidase II